MNITPEQVASIQVTARLQFGTDLTKQEIENAAANFDEEAILAERANSYEAELWDKTSPINGVDAETVLLGREDIPEGGEVYLIRRRGSNQVLFFQPHEPNAEGYKKVTSENWRDIADRHIETIVQMDSQAEFGVVLQKLIESKKASE